MGDKLVKAARNGDLKGCLEQLKHKVDVHWRCDRALRYAACYGHTEICELLLNNGANIHADDDCALIWAMENNHYNTCKKLIEYGAKLSACLSIYGLPKSTLHEFATQEQIEQAILEWTVESVMEG